MATKTVETRFITSKKNVETRPGASKKQEKGQKKEWARLLYTRENLTQKEIAAKTGVSAVTVNKWVKTEEWDKLRQSMLITRETQLSRLYMQLDELNASIMEREPGKRFADYKEADVISKHTKSIKEMETDASIADIVEVGKRLLNWLRPLNPDKALETAHTLDDFIKDILKR
jgi:transcriptional regulator with XRE-family HTH domain